MIRVGDIIDNPVTGERMLFHATAADTDGAAVIVEVTVEPNGSVASAHIHPYQTERFEILAGTLTFKRGREKIVAGPGEIVTVEPGTPHKFWNSGRETARFITEVTPALQFERLIETMFGLAAEGKTNGKGMPNPLRLAVIARAHFDDVRLPVVPYSLQRLALAFGAPFGRALGYEATYVPTRRELALAEL